MFNYLEMSDTYQMFQKDGYSVLVNKGGALLGVGPDMEAHILRQEGYAFKDLNRNGVLDPYEDWRLPLETRIADLAARMSVEEIAGLMLYSSHQAVCWVNPVALLKNPGLQVKETREQVWDLTEEQKKFLREDKLHHVLLSLAENAVSAAKWNNRLQGFAETLGLGIPVSISSDPRHGLSFTAEFDIGAGGDISMWPEHIGLAAAFDPALVRDFGRIASREYRAMGITTALSPQADLATDPRWYRFCGTFGEGTELVSDLIRAYCDGFQSSEGERDIGGGWGFDSVNTMVKHWPGGGCGESGRDAHYGFGKYAVYPGCNFEESLKPFTCGAFKLEGKTGVASALMLYYTISYNIDKKYGENVGNAYSRYIITDLLREKYGFDGVICTDWSITANEGAIDYFSGGKCWGAEHLSVAERHYKALMAGADQFGGNNQIQPVLDAYDMGVKEHGEAFMRGRFEQSARRLLRNIFRTGLFENPYVDPEETRRTSGSPDFVKKGYEAQLQSIVMLKNKNRVLPLTSGGVPGKPRVYIPLRHIPAFTDRFGRSFPARDMAPLDRALAEQYFELTDDPEAADYALCFIEFPRSATPYSKEEGYLPITLQYRPYRAENAREKSIAGDDRSYRGKLNVAVNEPDLDLVLKTRALMGSKPVIVVVKTRNPFVIAEFESAADAILLDFVVKPQAVLDIITGNTEPEALLPFGMPRDMASVEKQAEDVPGDTEVYTDECGNRYDFAFGLNWQGPISDARTAKYGKGDRK